MAHGRADTGGKRTTAANGGTGVGEEAARWQFGIGGLEIAVLK